VPVICTDDTYVTFLGGVEPVSHKGRIWVYIGPPRCLTMYTTLPRTASGTAFAVFGELCGISPSRRLPCV
jgi:hypothetical protein